MQHDATKREFTTVRAQAPARIGIPPLDNLRSLGIVWIPGLMAGMLLAHDSPIYASIYQFVVLALILASAGLTCSIGTRLIGRRAFSAAEQLMMRPAPVRELSRAR